MFLVALDVACVDAVRLQHRDEGAAEGILPDPRDIAARTAEARGREHEVGRVPTPAATETIDIAQPSGRFGGHFHKRLSDGDQVRQAAPPRSASKTQSPVSPAPEGGTTKTGFMVSETAVRSTVERSYGGAGTSAERHARMIGCARRKAGVQRGKGPGHEGSGAGGGDRRRHRRLQRALPSGEARLVRRHAGREDRAHRRLHLARGRAAAALQHELQRRPAAQVLDRPLSAAGGGNRAGGELPPHRQPPARHQPGADGRVPQLLRHG